jgi:cytochrome P450
MFGHLPIMMQYGKRRPADISPLHLTPFLMEMWRDAYPDLADKPLPPVFYIDMWPLDLPMVFCIDPNLSAQFTQETSLYKADSMQEIMKPMTGGKDILAARGDAFWRFWRAKFNPGFRSGFMQKLVPDILDEVIIFADVMKRKAAPDGGWGNVFAMEDETISLTLDAITRATLLVTLKYVYGMYVNVI